MESKHKKWLTESESIKQRKVERFGHVLNAARTRFRQDGELALAESKQDSGTVLPEVAMNLQKKR